MFKADLIERAATFRSAMEDPTRRLESCPALVLLSRWHDRQLALPAFGSWRAGRVRLGL